MNMSLQLSLCSLPATLIYFEEKVNSRKLFYEVNVKTKFKLLVTFRNIRISLPVF